MNSQGPVFFCESLAISNGQISVLMKQKIYLSVYVDQ